MEEKKQRIQNLLSRLDELQSNSGKKARIRELLGRLEDLNKKKEERKERTEEVVKIVDPKVEQIFTKLDEARNENASQLQEVSQGFSEEINAIREVLSTPKEEGPTLEQIAELEGRVDSLALTFDEKQKSILNADLLLQSEVSLVKQNLERLSSLPQTVSAQGKDIQKAQQTAEDTQKALEALERRVTSRISQITSHGGGNANRQILVNGSQSTLSYFTDINLIPGSNMGIAVGVDQTNKRTDLTIFGIPEGSGSVAAAGQNTQVQFNDGGFLGASSTFTWNKNSSVLAVGNVAGGTAANDDITIEGTSHATKTTSYVILQPTGGNVGIGIAAPVNTLDVSSGGAITKIGIENLNGADSRWELWNGDGYAGTGNAFSLYDFNNTAHRLTITAAGNLGIGTTTPNSNLQVNGSLSVPIKNVSSTYTVLSTDHTLLCEASTLGAFTVNLPTASVITGRVYVVKKTDATANAVTIDGNGAQTIDGAATASILTQYQAVTIQSDGTNWHVLSNNN